MTIDEIFEALANGEAPPYPREAMEAAVAQREAVTPRLREVVNDALRSIREEEEDNGFVLALYLLAQFRDTAAHAGIVRLFHEGGEEAADWSGDLVTEDLHRILADTFGGDWGPIEQLIGDPEAYRYARYSALRVYACLHIRAELSRKLFEARIARGMTEAIEQRDTVISSELIAIAVTFGLTGLEEKIRTLYAEGLADLDYIDTLDDMLNRIHDPECVKEAVAREGKFCTPIECAICETESWYCWEESEGYDEDELLAMIEEYEGIERVRRAVREADTFVHEEPKIGRNDPCPCGSGAKFKKCCGR